MGVMIELPPIENIFRHAFASCCLWGEAGNLGISGIWVFKGQQLAFEHSEDWQVSCFDSYCNLALPMLWTLPKSLYIRWIMQATIGSNWIPVILTPVLLSISTWGCTSDEKISHIWIAFLFQMGWGGSGGTKILPWESFQMMNPRKLRIYNKSVTSVYIWA